MLLFSVYGTTQVLGRAPKDKLLFMTLGQSLKQHQITFSALVDLLPKVLFFCTHFAQIPRL